jgi:uncharacterized membrane protein YhiD involved in acid resistance
MEKVLNFNDILKKGVLKLDVFEKVSSYDIIFGLFISLLVGMFIFYVYKVCFKGVVYSYTYNVSLVLMCLICSLIIMTISSNIVLSLGMVGALSIVRFRTALKDPMDIIFMFWSISVGIANGAGIYPISIIGSLFVGFVLIIFSKFNLKNTSYIFVIHYSEKASDEVKIKLNKLKYSLKSKSVSGGETELTVEVKVKGDNTLFVEDISSIDGVRDAVLVGYNGEYAA